ncbi:hypothetical protein ACOQFV_27945 [Nocardiopsis changdeensis]|uniref:Flp family type IVb pilin n=1 Tax=Nocardiopsis changdeensis TaxID=2831969 RepID=A0ABX8BEW3_9ACTN|nr:MULTISPECIES: hypothetical protein [Nocardiopsis]QUX20794.1 hypothetical protein KGD84_20210 [Nocardiopsis changdeensis]QYX36726.1 hypothetical protein K1J57_29665 [Nocardiopsis sp. MT53]
MKELYYRIVTALTLPKDDGGYSTETVVVTALLILVGIAAVGGISTFVAEEIASFGTP